MALTQVDQGLLGTYAQYTGFKNRIINGAMVIDQRNAGASVTNIAGTAYATDRWATFGSQASKFTAQQNAGSVTPPAGFTKYLGVTSSSAYTVGSSEVFTIYQPIEGFNIADFGWGTSSAAPITLSFWVRSSLTGTFGGRFSNGSYNRSYVFTYTVSSANTWEYKTVTIAGDTTGTWASDNSLGTAVVFSLGSGSTYNTTSGSWQAGNYVSTTGATSVVGTNGATFYITGVQLEKGSTATSFDYRPYGTELALCQRYFWKIGSSTGYTGFNAGWQNSQLRTALACPVPMRAAASVTFTGTASAAFFATTNDSAYTNFSYSSGASAQQASTTAVVMQCSADTASGNGLLFIQDGRSLSISAEL